MDINRAIHTLKLFINKSIFFYFNNWVKKIIERLINICVINFFKFLYYYSFILKVYIKFAFNY
jgi:hypothetical protein